MQVYKDLITDILESGHDHTDRTGVGTKRLFVKTARFDLREGFPIVTLKKTPFRLVLSELLWFISGSTNVKYLLDRDNHIWSLNALDYFKKRTSISISITEFESKVLSDADFAGKYGNLGHMYGYQWRKSQTNRAVVRVNPRVSSLAVEETSYPIFKLLELEEKSYLSNSGEFRIIKESKKRVGTNTCYDIQFIKTGYVKRSVTSSTIQKGNVKDPYFPLIFGYGYVGEAKVEDKSLYMLWYHMISRCYNELDNSFACYGGSGVRVDTRWLNFSNFQKDVKSLYGYNQWQRARYAYQLDKDYYSSKIYSRDTCVFLSNSDNNLYRTAKPFWIKYPDGSYELGLCQSHVAKRLGLQRKNINQVLSGEKRTHYGFEFEFFKTEGIYRYELSEDDQITNIINLIKTEPNSRRILLSSWNPEDIKSAVLPPCHVMAQFYVSDSKLSCMFVMRSVDVFLGLPFNIASYALLTHILANICDLEVGELVWVGNDVHIYSNHFDQCRELLTREPLQLPKLVIKRKLTGVDDLSEDDFELVDYQCHSAIKGEMAI